MPARSRLRFAVFCSIGLGLLLSACQPAASVAQDVPTTAATSVQVVASAPPIATDTAIPVTSVPAATSTSAPSATLVPAATAAARPTDTPTTPPTATASPTVAPTATIVPTVAPTATKKPTARPTTPPQPTTPPTQAATQAPVAPASIYSTASGGPQGYVSTLTCTQPGNAPCTPVMAAGDKAFAIKLEALDNAVPAIFVPFGLSVEKDGANVADMYMTVVSGWLNPGEYAMLGTIRHFSEPGRYVIRTNGCYVTRETYPNCSWGTVDGTIVTFVIQ